MKKTLGAIALTVALIAGAGVASAMPTDNSLSEWETVFDPKD